MLFTLATLLSVLYISCVASVRLICQFEEYVDDKYGNHSNGGVSWNLQCSHDGKKYENGYLYFTISLFDMYACRGEHFTEHGGYSFEPIGEDCGGPPKMRLKWDGKTCESDVFFFKVTKDCHWFKLEDGEICRTFAYVCDV